MLYELLTLAAPPDGDIAARAVPPSQLRKDVPPRLDALIFSMMAADREDRPKNAEAILDELRDIEKTADLELLIAGGESPSLEFKQTMRWDTRLQKNNPEVLGACVRTVRSRRLASACRPANGARASPAQIRLAAGTLAQACG